MTLLSKTALTCTLTYAQVRDLIEVRDLIWLIHCKLLIYHWTLKIEE